MSDPIADFIQKKSGSATEYLEKLETMLNDPEQYDWAEETLISIYDFVQDRGYITKKQMESVDKIQQSIYAERSW